MCEEKLNTNTNINAIIVLSANNDITFNKIKDSSPSEVQTGPAKREDYNTIEKHLNLLEGKSDLQIIYSRITNHIINNNLDE